MQSSRRREWLHSYPRAVRAEPAISDPAPIATGPVVGCAGLEFVKQLRPRGRRAIDRFCSTGSSATLAGSRHSFAASAANARHGVATATTTSSSAARLNLAMF
jgi:hypothetical protein